MEHILEDIIYQSIAQHIQCKYLDVRGDGRHFDAVVVSDEFIGKARLERHRLVYQALGDKMETLKNLPVNKINKNIFQ